MAIILPDEKQKKLLTEPAVFLFYGLEKIGKTTIVSELPNCLHIDFERGTKYVDTARVNCESWEELVEIKNAVLAREKKYSFIALDTLTAMEAYCRKLATETYMGTNQGKNFNRDKVGKILPVEEWNDVIDALGQNGYLYIFNAWRKMMDTVMEMTQEGKYPTDPTKIILVGHMRDKYIDPNSPTATIKAVTKELDLTGKLKTMTLQSYADSIAKCYRDKQGNLIFNFQAGDEDISAGSRVGPINQKVDSKVIWKTLYPSIIK